MMEDFDWGVIAKNEWFVQVLKKEIFTDHCYEKFFPVVENDLVVDIGASIGPFTYSVMDKKPRRVFCLEPSIELFPTLLHNTERFKEVICLNRAITNKDGQDTISGMYNPHRATNAMGGGNNSVPSIRFKTFLDTFGIKAIDFLKLDCEGGEYDVFTEENFPWMLETVRKISGEWHLGSHMKEFRNFYNMFLRRFPKFEVTSSIGGDHLKDSEDVKGWIHDINFDGYYETVNVFIDNR